MQLPEDDGPQSVLPSKVSVQEASEHTDNPVLKYMQGSDTEEPEIIENAQQVMFNCHKSEYESSYQNDSK